MPRPPDNLEEILAAVAGGNLSPAEAAERLREGEVRYLDEFAVLDLGRAARKGVPEIVKPPGPPPGPRSPPRAGTPPTRDAPRRALAGPGQSPRAGPGSARLDRWSSC